MISISSSNSSANTTVPYEHSVDVAALDGDGILQRMIGLISELKTVQQQSFDRQVSAIDQLKKLLCEQTWIVDANNNSSECRASPPIEVKQTVIVTTVDVVGGTDTVFSEVGRQCSAAGRRSSRKKAYHRLRQERTNKHKTTFSCKILRPFIKKGTELKLISSSKNFKLISSV